MFVDGSFVEDLLTDGTVSVVRRLLVRRDEVRLLKRRQTIIISFSRVMVFFRDLSL